MNRIKNKNYRIGCIIATIGVLAITLLLRNCFGQTWNLELNKLASIDNIERISGVDFPDYKVIKKKKLWGFDGFEHQISLRFKNMPDSLFYQQLFIKSSQVEINNDSLIEMSSQYWSFSDSTFLFHINYEPNYQSSEYTREYLHLMGFSDEQLTKRKISIKIKIPISQKKWFIIYSESI